MTKIVSEKTALLLNKKRKCGIREANEYFHEHLNGMGDNIDCFYTDDGGSVEKIIADLVKDVEIISGSVYLLEKDRYTIEFFPHNGGSESVLVITLEFYITVEGICQKKFIKLCVPCADIEYQSNKEQSVEKIRKISEKKEELIDYIAKEISNYLAKVTIRRYSVRLFIDSFRRKLLQEAEDYKKLKNVICSNFAVDLTNGFL